ncbi:MAG: Crp/Fnr family transcriptional regulator [Rubrimonas sp.]|uniref:Crp/Fnr family transcriptional regulator n=1 Tax=Rubrimonas sp. TaxID=2036015 RepID=UPI002FDDE8CF
MSAEPPPRSVFSSASPALLAAVARAASPVRVEAGAALFGQGDAADCFYIVDHGEIEISVMSPGGRKLTLEIMTPGEVFGEIGLFAGRRTAGAAALGPALLRRVRRSDLLAIIRRDPELALEFIEILCARLRTNSEHLQQRAFLPLPTRLAARLLALAVKVGAPDGAVRVSQAELADFAGATREAVAKTLALWKREGWISLSRGELRILDRGALGALAESAEE